MISLPPVAANYWCPGFRVPAYGCMSYRGSPSEIAAQDHLGFCPHMQLRLRDSLVIDRAKRNAAKLRQTRWFVPKRGPARAAKGPEAIS